jgi:putative methanogenesis marker protein 8
MNGLFYTTPIPDIMTNLQNHNSIVLSPADAKMDQAEGVMRAAQSGYRRVAVTVRGDEEDAFHRIREIEKNKNIEVIILAVCNTGISEKQAEIIKNYGDLAWACASKYIRDIAGPSALLQIGMKIPVFVLTGNGLDFITSYSDDAALKEKLKNIKNKHYITSGKFKNEAIKMRMGKFSVYLYETEELPVSTSDEPEPLI